MSDFMLTLGGLSLAMSAVILLAMLIFRLTGRRYTAKCRHIVWAAIILRLCIPFSVGILPSLISFQVPDAVRTVKLQSLPSASEPAPIPAFSEPETVSQTVGAPEQPLSTGDASGGTVPEREFFGLGRIIFVCWLTIAAGSFSVRLLGCSVSLGRLKRRLTGASGEVRAIYERLGRQMKLKRLPELYISDGVQSPMLCGILKPMIVLPDLRLSGSSLMGILSHELTHYHRHDLWLKLACTLAESLHWFNPLVRIAARRCGDAMELSCDEEILSGMDGEVRRSYGNMLLGILKSCRQKDLSLTTHFNPQRSAVKERFVNIMDSSKKNKGVIVIASALILCLLSGAVFSCEDAPQSGIGGQTDAMAEYSEEESELISLLSEKVVDIKAKYGDMTLQYSEQGPGQPVYSIDKLNGVLAVFYGWEMNDPLDSELIPSELIVTDENDSELFGVRVGDMVENVDIEWSCANFSVENGTAEVSYFKNGLKFTAIVYSDSILIPDSDDPDESERLWNEWRELYRQSPSGKIVQLRIKYPKRSEYPESDGKAQTATTLAEIRAAVDCGRISENAYRFFYNLLSGKSGIPEYNTVKISEFTLTYTDTREDFDMIFDFTVAESGLDTLPAGKYHKRVRDIVDCLMTDFGEDSKYPPEYEQYEEVRMVYAFISGSFILNCPEFGKSTTYPGMNNYLCNYYGNGSLPLDEYKRLAEEKFGCTDLDALGIDGLIYEQDGKKFVCAGGIGGGWSGDVAFVKKADGETQVGIQFYADCNRLIKSYLVAYTLADGGVWRGCELVNDSPYQPYGLTKAND